jgi:flavin-dependent dehydrogenase
MKIININGAGISGLTAAINLSLEGYDVTVHERLSDVGVKNRLNFEGLENWTYDLMKTLKEINVKSDFKKRVMRELTWYSPTFRRADLKSKEPFFYLVERGGKNSLEYSLKKQALNAGVKIKFKSTASRPDIVSTGTSRPMAFGFGTTYENVDCKDSVIAVLSDKMSPKGYFYIIVWDKRATVCSTIYEPSHNSNLSGIHEYNLQADICRNILSGSKKIGSFSGFINFIIPKTAVVNGSIYTGEAAGFQDAFLGFGMKYSLLSGYFAAKSIIDGVPYDRLWKESFEKELKKTAIMRFMLNTMGDAGYERLVSYLQEHSDCKKILKGAYCGFDWKKELLFQSIKLRLMLNKNNFLKEEIV